MRGRTRPPNALAIALAIAARCRLRPHAGSLHYDFRIDMAEC